MFNKKEYRFLKKLHCLNSRKNAQVQEISNMILKKNKKIIFFKKIIFTENIRKLLPGLRNVCSVTGGYRAVFNSMKVSRHVYRDLGDTSMLPNFSKLSWTCLIDTYFLIKKKRTVFVFGEVTILHMLESSPISHNTN